MYFTSLTININNLNVSHIEPKQSINTQENNELVFYLIIGLMIIKFITAS